MYWPIWRKIGSDLWYGGCQELGGFEYYCHSHLSHNQRPEVLGTLRITVEDQNKYSFEILIRNGPDIQC